MNYEPITAVSIDVSKGKSAVAVRRSGSEVVLTPFSVEHNSAGRPVCGGLERPGR